VLDLDLELVETSNMESTAFHFARGGTIENYLLMSPPLTVYFRGLEKHA